MKVTVRADEHGNVVVQSKQTPEWGYIRVTQIRPSFDENGFMKTSEVSALIKGRVEDLNRLNFKANEEVPGIIYFRESMTPFTEVNPERHLKIAGETKVVCKVNGMPIYRESFYSTRDRADELIAHTNKEEIKKAQLELVEESEEVPADLNQ